MCFRKTATAGQQEINSLLGLGYLCPSLSNQLHITRKLCLPSSANWQLTSGANTNFYFKICFHSMEYGLPAGHFEKSVPSVTLRRYQSRLVLLELMLTLHDNSLLRYEKSFCCRLNCLVSNEG